MTAGTDVSKPGIAVCASAKGSPFSRTLYLIPRGVHVGIGCRKGMDFETIRRNLERGMAENGIPAEAIVSVSSIDLKKEEDGIRRLAAFLKVPFLTFSAEALNRTEGDFTASGFVKRITGTDNVCERSAMLSAGRGARPVMHKTAFDGVTIAAAQASYTVIF